MHLGKSEAERPQFDPMAANSLILSFLTWSCGESLGVGHCQGDRTVRFAAR